MGIKCVECYRGPCREPFIGWRCHVSGPFKAAWSWWKTRNNPMCRLIDLAEQMSNHDLTEGIDYLTALRQSREDV